MDLAGGLEVFMKEEIYKTPVHLGLGRDLERFVVLSCQQREWKRVMLQLFPVQSETVYMTDHPESLLLGPPDKIAVVREICKFVTHCEKNLC